MRKESDEFICACGTVFTNTLEFCRRSNILGQTQWQDLEFLWVDCGKCRGTRLIEITDTIASKLPKILKNSISVLSDSDIDMLCGAIVKDILSNSTAIDPSRVINYNGMVAENIGPHQFRLYVAPDNGTTITDLALIKELEKQFIAHNVDVISGSPSSLREKYRINEITLEGCGSILRCIIDGNVAYLTPPLGFAFRGRPINKLGPTVFPRVTEDEFGFLIDTCKLILT